MMGRLRPELTYLLRAFLFLGPACSQAASRPASKPATPSPSPARKVSQSSPTATAEPVTVISTPASPPASANDGAPTLALRVPTDPPPKVDTSIASVSLDNIYFYTFDGGSIRLSRASDVAIERLRDRIKPIYLPNYEPVEGGYWLAESDLVIGYAADNGEAFAYSLKILNFHEIVHDIIDGIPVLVSYCPLCASSVVYSRELDGAVHTFGNTSALYESDMVMFDHETGSYWFQVLGEAIVGALTGQRLETLPSTTATWGQWKGMHPETRVLSRDLGLLGGNPYARDLFVGYDRRVNREQFAFPVDKDRLDDRLRAGDRVLAIQVGETHKAYPLIDTEDKVVNDEVGGEKVVVIARVVGPTASAYLSTLGGQTFTFNLNDGVVEDVETGTKWDDGGHAISGPMVGAQLTRVPSRTSFWFSVVGALPDIELHTP